MGYLGFAFPSDASSYVLYDGAPDFGKDGPAPTVSGYMVERHRINILGVSPTLARDLSNLENPSALDRSPGSHDSILVWRSTGILATMTEAKPKKKATFYLPEDLLRAAKVQAARTDKRDSELIEAALRAYLGWDVLDELWAKNDMSEDEAMELAVSEIHAMRKEKRAARRP